MLLLLTRFLCSFFGLSHPSMSMISISSPPMPATGNNGVGLGYGIAIAVGILVLVSTIMLASYVCVRVNGGPRTSDDISNFSNNTNNNHTETSLYPSITVTVGLDEPTIESYPKFTYGSSCSDSISEPCPICLSKYKRNETLRSMPECEHFFHAKCVDEWLRVSATCPLCRNSPLTTPVATPLSELIPLAFHVR